MIDPVASLALRAFLAWLLASAALGKLRDLAGFTTAVAGYRLLPAALAKPAALAFVAAELALAAGLWLPGLEGATAVGGALLFALYALAIALNLARGRRDIDCGCGGPLGRQGLSAGLVARNVVLVVAALATVLPSAPRVLGALDAFTLAASVLAAALLYAAANTLLARPRLAT